MKTVAPLLTFPPNKLPVLSSLPSVDRHDAAAAARRTRNPIMRALLALPLVFVFVALLFPFWAYEMSMVLVSCPAAGIQATELR